MKKIFLILITAMIAFTSCSKKDSPAYRRNIVTQKLLKKHRIKIAVTGQWSSPSGTYIRQGAELAENEINETGGVLGAKIELLKFDDNNKVSQGAELAGKITADEEICAVIGHYSSSVSLFNDVIYHYYGLLMLTPFSTNTKLTKQNLPYIFRNIPANDAFAKEAVKFAYKKNWKRVMAIYLNNAYCSELLDSFEQYCGENSIIVPDRSGYEEVYNLSNYMEIAEKWKNNYAFDAIFIAGFLPQAAEIIALFRAEGINVPVIGSIDFDSAEFFEIADNKNEENFYCISTFSPNSTNTAFTRFKKAFKEKYGKEPNWEACQAYDAVKVLAKAIEKAGSVKHEDIAAALRAEEVWNESSGPYHFNESGDIEKQLFVKKSSRGEFKVLGD